MSVQTSPPPDRGSASAPDGARQDGTRRRARRLRPPTPPIRRLLMIGGALLVTLTVEIVVMTLLDPALARAAITGIAVEVFTGREGGIPIALQGGVPPLLVWQLSVTQDLMAVAITFPLIAYTLERYHDSTRWPMRILHRMERAALRHHDAIRKWGPVGVFVFMVLPFMVNGPLVATTAGFLTHMPGKRLAAAVVGGTMVAAAGWVWFFEFTLGFLRSIGGPLAPLWFTAAILTLIVGGWAVGQVREFRRERREAAGRGWNGEEE